MIRSANNAVAISLPVLASVLSFVVYSLSGHSLNAADVFASLTLFTLLRLPLMFLRELYLSGSSSIQFSFCLSALSFSAIADAQNAIGRLYGVFEAELISETKIQDPAMDVAIRVVEADFTWDSPPPEVQKGDDGKDLVAQTKEIQELVFNLKNVNMEIPKGQLTAIVGKWISHIYVRRS